MPEGIDEPTTVCPNCGALVPVGAPRCFICDEPMPEQAPPKVEEKKEPVPEVSPPIEPAKEPIPEIVVIPAEEKAEAIQEKPPETVPVEAPAEVVETKVEPPPEVKKEEAVVEAPPVVEATIPAEVKMEEPPKLPEIPVEMGAKPTIEEPVPEAPPAVEEQKMEPAVEEKPAKKLTGADKKKLAKLKRAYDSGKMTREALIENLEKMGVPIPPELAAPPAEEEIPVEKPEEKPEAPAETQAAPEVKEEIPPEMPAAKVEKPAIVAEVPAEAPPSAPSETEVKAGRLKAAFEAGRIPREVYVENLRTLGIAVPPELELPTEEAPAEVELPPEEKLEKEMEAAPIGEWKLPEEIEKEIEQAAAPVQAEAAVEVVEEVIPEEVPSVVEEAAPVEEEAAAPVELVSKGEIEEPEKSYRGVALASAGGLLYVMVWLIIRPMMGNVTAGLLAMLGAVMIVVGYNVAASDRDAAARARMFNCPLCSVRLDISVAECSNCGAKFSD